MVEMVLVESLCLKKDWTCKVDNPTTTVLLIQRTIKVDSESGCSKTPMVDKKALDEKSK